MENTIIVDGQQFILDTDYPLTEEQKIQAASDIMGYYAPNIEGNIRSLTTDCITVTVQAPAGISIQNINIGGIDCSTGPTCPTDLMCPSPDCTSMSTTVTVTFANSGDVPGDITPNLQVGGLPVPGMVPVETTPISVPSLGTAVATFVGVTLARGSNNICINY